MDEIKRLCMEQLELLSEKKLLKILEGMNETFRLHCTPVCLSRICTLSSYLNMHVYIQTHISKYILVCT